MAQDFNAKKARAEIRNRLHQVKDEIKRQRDYKEFAATHDHEYRVADARIAGLKAEREKLKEVLGDLR